MSLESTNDDSDDEDLYLCYLNDKYYGWKDALNELMNHPITKSCIAYAGTAGCTSSMTATEVEKALDPSYIEWEILHTNIIEGIANLQSKSKYGASLDSVQFSESKTELKREFCNNRIEDFDATKERRNSWRSLLQTLACTYITILENSARSNLRDLHNRIDEILAKEWKPDDDTHEQCIYYICGAMLSAANKKIQQQRTLIHYANLSVLCYSYSQYQRKRQEKLEHHRDV